MLNLNSQKALQEEHKRNIENLSKHKASPECTGVNCKKMQRIGRLYKSL